MSGFLYRKWVRDDIERMAELRIWGLLEEGAEATTDITDRLLNFYQTHLAEGTFVAWVATVNDKIIATSGMSLVEKPPYYSNATGRIGLLSNMYTVPEYRRRGVAKTLLHLIVHEAKERGCGVILLKASDVGAYLYQDFGFVRNPDFFQYELG